jgi:hypothetical protein
VTEEKCARSAEQEQLPIAYSYCSKPPIHREQRVTNSVYSHISFFISELTIHTDLFRHLNITQHNILLKYKLCIT